MKEKQPTTTEGSGRKRRVQLNPLENAMKEWTKAGSKGERRSALVIQVTEKNGEIYASSYINGVADHLVAALVNCLLNNDFDNYVGRVLRKSFVIVKKYHDKAKADSDNTDDSDHE